MKEYQVNVIRERKNTVIDTYTVLAENEEELKDKAQIIVEDPELLVTLPHDTLEGLECEYSKEFYVTYNLKDSKTQIPLHLNN